MRLNIKQLHNEFTFKSAKKAVKGFCVYQDLMSLMWESVDQR